MRILLSFAAFFCSLSGFSQVFWTEDFSAGSAARGTSAIGYPASSGGNWSQTITGPEGASANEWYVSGEECGNVIGTCGTACSNGDASLHISAIGGLCGIPDCGAAYNETGAANATSKRIESPNINTTGYGGLTLEFGYVAAQGDDGFTVEYSCDGGASWSTLTNPAASQCCSCLDAFICGFIGLCCPPQTQQSCALGGQGYWTTFSMALPVCAENISNFRIGFNWINDGNGVGTDPSVAIDDISISSVTPLPVDLVNVTAKETKNGNLISWSTLSEMNNSHFIIEHAHDANDFQVVGRAEGKGTTTETSDYSWMHTSVAPGDNYYRLKQVDFDGEFEYSQTLLVRNELSEEKRLFLYPNPANEQIIAQYFSQESAQTQFLVIDNSGRVVLQKSKDILTGENNHKIDISSLDKGRYLFVVVENGARTTESFVKL